jgi:membrane fusion protein (multidrug efflux system)
MQLAVLDHRLAELSLARSRALVEQRVVRSPIGGIVVQRLLGPGEYVHQDAPIVQVAAIDPLYVEAFPPVRYFPFIKIGMKAEVKPAITGQPAHEVTVTIVDHVFDAASGTFGVRLALPNPNGDLSAGLRCQVSMPIDIIPDSVPTDAAVR